MSANKLIRGIKSRPVNPKCGCCIAKKQREQKRVARLVRELQMGYSV